jgi:hypothetical protein
MNRFKLVLVPILLISTVAGFLLLSTYFLELPLVVSPNQEVRVEKNEVEEVIPKDTHYKVSDFVDESTVATSTKTYIDPKGRFTFEYVSTLRQSALNTAESDSLFFCELDSGFKCDIGQEASVRVRILDNSDHTPLKNFTRELYTYENEFEETRNVMYDALVEGTTKTGYPMLLTIREDEHGKAIESDIHIALPEAVLVFNDFNLNLPVVYTQTMVHTLRLLK